MNITLLKKEFKSNYKIALIFLAVITMYCSMIVAMFDPKLGESLKMMSESMPELFSAFGMAAPASTLTEFIANYLYGFILLVFPLIFIILLANRLVARYVDKGSMAYLLATPNKRRNIVVTQAVVMILLILILVFYATILCVIFSEVMFSGELDIKNFLVLNVGLYGLLFFFGGLCFLSSCAFNDSRFSYGVGGALCILFVLMQMVSQAGEKFEAIKYGTPLTLFRANELILGDSNAIVSFLALYAMGIVLYGLAIAIFNKKDLSL